MNLDELERSKGKKVFLLKSFEAIKVLTKHFNYFNRSTMIHNQIYGLDRTTNISFFISFNIVEEKKQKSKSKLAAIVTPAVFGTIVLIAVVVVIFW